MARRRAAERFKDRAPHSAQHLVGNQSERLHGVKPTGIAVHSTESQDLSGTRDDLVAIRNWFDNPASQASSHIGIDGQGNTEQWVMGHRKAWTILQLNSVTLNIEFIGRAAQPASAWEDEQIKQGARWAAWWGIYWDIPMQRGAVGVAAGQPYLRKKGIIRHKDLTDAGFGSHTDPGPNFPMAEFIDYAQWYRANGWTL